MQDPGDRQAFFAVLQKWTVNFAGNIILILKN